MSHALQGLDGDKKRVRATLRTAWRAVSPEALAALSASITRRVLDLPEWQAAAAVMLYLPMKGELDIASLAEDALAKGKVLTVPKVNWDEKHMSPVRLSEWNVTTSRKAVTTPLAAGRPFIPAPPAEATDFPVAKLDLIVVPGLGFDSNGNRLGRGAGFYDRFLQESGFSARAIALAPDAMILESVPAGAMDVPVAVIVTESRLIRA